MLTAGRRIVPRIVPRIVLYAGFLPRTTLLLCVHFFLRGKGTAVIVGTPPAWVLVTVDGLATAVAVAVV